MTFKQKKTVHKRQEWRSIDQAVNVVAWFENNTDKMTLAHYKDLAWVILRIHDDKENKSVPALAPFNEATSIVDPQLTTAGMLPILQVPTDDNNIMTTVINHFIQISTHINQKHTMITADQTLYSREKEIVWSNPIYQNVIFLLGGLHICFNFLKGIGQHMESAELDDLWTAEVYATNTA